MNMHTIMPAHTLYSMYMQTTYVYISTCSHEVIFGWFSQTWLALFLSFFGIAINTAADATDFFSRTISYVNHAEKQTHLHIGRWAIKWRWECEIGRNDGNSSSIFVVVEFFFVRTTTHKNYRVWLKESGARKSEENEGNGGKNVNAQKSYNIWTCQYWLICWLMNI